MCDSADEAGEAARGGTACSAADPEAVFVAVAQQDSGAAVQLAAGKALELWRGVLVGGLQAAQPDLTTRQLAILLQVYLMPPPHTVRGLARELRISKPAVTRALDRLVRGDLVRRKRDEADRRSVLVQRTVKGSVFLRDFGELAAGAAKAL